MSAMTDPSESGETDPSRSAESTESAEPTVECPFCASTDVVKESAFGSEISKEKYYCNGCKTIFERIKYDGKQPDTGR